MKSETISALLVLILFIGALASVWLASRWFFSVKEMQQLQGQQLRINNARAAAQSLANEAVAYGRKSPEIEPILKEFNLLRGLTNQVPVKAAE